MQYDLHTKPFGKCVCVRVLKYSRSPSIQNGHFSTCIQLQWSLHFVRFDSYIIWSGVTKYSLNWPWMRGTYVCAVVLDHGDYSRDVA